MGLRWAWAEQEIRIKTTTRRRMNRMFGANENKAITGDKKLTAETRRMLRKN
jgi:hypothetical protein